jgi:hypothetical protein
LIALIASGFTLNAGDAVSQRSPVGERTLRSANSADVT